MCHACFYVATLSVFFELYLTCCLCVLFSADFGFARFLESGVMAGTLCGSPMYMVHFSSLSLFIAILTSDINPLLETSLLTTMHTFMVMSKWLLMGGLLPMLQQTGPWVGGTPTPLPPLYQM